MVGIPHADAPLDEEEDPIDSPAQTTLTETHAARLRATWETLEDMEPTGALPAASIRELKGNTAFKWTIFDHRPPKVPKVIWNALVDTTRQEHIRLLIRLKTMDADLRNTPLGRAIVETVLRYASKRLWVWSTVASALSAIASALRSLPIYTTEVHPIDLKGDPFFINAAQRAQKLARSAAPQTSLTAPMSPDQMKRICEHVSPKVRLLLQMTWHFAARVGDMRQIRNKDVALPQSATGQLVHVTFRYGKGGAFWGPYTIAAVLPTHVLKDLSGSCHSSPRDQALWTPKDQSSLSRAVAPERVSPCDPYDGGLS